MKEAGIPYRTAVRWVAGYRKDGLAALARKGRSDDGARRLATERLVHAIEGLALERPPAPITSIHRRAISIANTLGERRLSYPVVRRIVRALPSGLTTLAHRGARAYGETFDLVHRREASRANAIWQVDHAQLGIRIVQEDGSTARPWLTIVIDDYSRAVAGYYLGFEPPSSLRTALALRQGIWRKGDPHWEICGIPETLYTDNGADFTSKHIEQVAVDLKIRLVFSTPGQPRGRGRIERFFRTVNEMFLYDLDGYGARPKRAPSLTLTDLDREFRKFLLKVYHRRPSSEGKPSPKDRWEEGAFLPRVPESLEQLDLLLIHELRSRRVRPDGIHFHSFRYLSLTLAAYVGEEVTIRYDPRAAAHALGASSLLRPKPRQFQRLLHLQCQGRDPRFQPTWREPLNRGRRCLVPTDGFYEWKVLGPKDKQPYAFTVDQDSTFAFAGLWDAWHDRKTDVWLQSFAIITTTPNDLTGTVHTRMPVILHDRDYDEWLLRDDGPPPVHLLQPFPAA